MLLWRTKGESIAWLCRLLEGFSCRNRWRCKEPKNAVPSRGSTKCSTSLPHAITTARFSPPFVTSPHGKRNGPTFRGGWTGSSVPLMPQRVRSEEHTSELQSRLHL